MGVASWMSVALHMLILPIASSFSIFPRHHGDDHDHHHDNDTLPAGTGAGHSQSHGLFNFTPSGIEWPICLRDCCNAFFQYFPEPVNHPLCINEEFYDNVTACVASDCTEYEQGVYTVVATIECPSGNNYELEPTVAQVTNDVEEDGGSPQTCHAMNNVSVHCNNGSSVEEGGASNIRASGPLTLFTSGVLLFAAAEVLI